MDGFSSDSDFQLFQSLCEVLNDFSVLVDDDGYSCRLLAPQLFVFKFKYLSNFSFFHFFFNFPFDFASIIYGESEIHWQFCFSFLQLKHLSASIRLHNQSSRGVCACAIGLYGRDLFVCTISSGSTFLPSQIYYFYLFF